MRADSAVAAVPFIDKMPHEIKKGNCILSDYIVALLVWYFFSMTREELDISTMQNMVFCHDYMLRLDVAARSCYIITGMSYA